MNDITDDDTIWRRNLAVCVFGAFTTVMAMTVLVPFLPIYVEQLGVHGHAAIAEWSGVVFSATFLASGASAPLWGRFADRYGRRLIMIRASLGMALCMSLTGLAHDIWQLLGIRLLTGLLGGYASGATILVATQTPKARAGWALGTLSSGIMAGGLLGPLIGGVLPEWIGIRLTFLIVGGVIFIAFLATVALIRERRVPGGRATVVRPWAQVPDVRLVTTLLATGGLVAVAGFSIEPIVTLFLRTLLPAGAHLTVIAGLAMSATALGSALAAPIIGRRADRIGVRPVMIASLLACTVALLLQAVVQTGWQLVVLRFVMGVALAGVLPVVTGAIRHAIPAEIAGSILAWNTTANSVGAVVGPVLGGFVGAHVGLRWVFVATACATAAGAALLMPLRGLRRQG